MSAARAFRFNDLLNLPDSIPQPEKAPFHRIQDTLLDFGSQTRIACTTLDEAQTILKAGNQIMFPLREQIMILVRNVSVVSPEQQELINLYNGVWDNLMKIESRYKIVRLLVSDISLDDDGSLPTVF